MTKDIEVSVPVADGNLWMPPWLARGAANLAERKGIDKRLAAMILVQEKIDKMTCKQVRLAKDLDRTAGRPCVDEDLQQAILQAIDPNEPGAFSRLVNNLLREALAVRRSGRVLKEPSDITHC